MKPLNDKNYYNHINHLIIEKIQLLTYLKGIFTQLFVWLFTQIIGQNVEIQSLDLFFHWNKCFCYYSESKVPKKVLLGTGTKFQVPVKMWTYPTLSISHKDLFQHSTDIMKWVWSKNILNVVFSCAFRWSSIYYRAIVHWEAAQTAVINANYFIITWLYRSNGVALNTQSHRSLTSYAISHS